MATLETVDERQEHDRYTRHNILRAEQMYGRGFQSPGQQEAVRAACSLLNLRPGMRVLDIGSGLGGPAMYLARHHGVTVVGLDVAAAMIELSAERLRESGVGGVRFVHGDVRTVPLDPASFDVVWTRDTILYVEDKETLWARAHALLRPGGQLYVADFCRGAGDLSADFQTYLRTAGYHLQTLDDYSAMLRASGFTAVQAQDRTEPFRESLSLALQRLEMRRQDFLAEFSPEDFTYLVERWHKKITFCARGELRWGQFVARTPSDPAAG